MKKKPAKFEVEITTDQKPVISQSEDRVVTYGYSPHPWTLLSGGRPIELSIKKDGEFVFSMSFDEDGSIHITNCMGMYEHLFGTTVRLKNTRSWEKS